MRVSGAVLRLIRGKLIEEHGIKLSLDVAARISGCIEARTQEPHGAVVAATGKAVPPGSHLGFSV